MQQLCELTAKALQSNEDLAMRIDRLETESVLNLDTATRPTPDNAVETKLHTGKLTEEEVPTCTTPFEKELQESRVYNMRPKRFSMSSLTSSAVHSTALSSLSGMSLSQVSCISFYALPVYAKDLSNSEQYVFGEQGATSVVASDRAASRPPRQLRGQPSRRMLHEPVSIENLSSTARFARRDGDGRRIEPWRTKTRRTKPNGGGG